MLTLLHLSDIHLGSGLTYGRVNPKTGWNTRLEDFVASLSQCIDRALAEPVDLVLFGGDAFPDATPPPHIHEAFACQFRRLADAGIPTVLLTGNHDQYAQGQGGSSLSLYRALGVAGFIVGDRLETHHIQTRHGAVQVITLPWLTRSTLLTRTQTQGLNLSQVNHLLIDRLQVALEGEIRQLDPNLPTVLLAHLMVDTARYGAERFLAVSKGFTIPLSLLARPCFDYVALGHVHQYQQLCDRPPVVYPGSIDRVDFSEEHETKGYVLAHLERGSAQITFCPLQVRPFRTLTVDISTTDDPQGVLMQEIATSLAAGNLTEAIVRLIYHLRPDQVPQIDQSELANALATAHSYTLQPQLVGGAARSRLPDIAPSSGLDPLSALETYLTHHPALQEIIPDLLAAARTLIENDLEQISLSAAESDVDLSPHVMIADPFNDRADPPEIQLSLL